MDQGGLRAGGVLTGMGTTASTAGPQPGAGAGAGAGAGPGAAAGAGAGAPASPAAALRALHTAGRLAEEYPRVKELLATATGPELAAAGQLLARLDPHQVTAAHSQVPALTVAVTGHGTLSGLLPALTGELARHGVLLRPHTTDFDSYVFELGDPASELYACAPDLVCCVLDPGVVFDEVPAPWRPEDVERVLRRKLDLIEGLAQRFGESCGGTLVLNTLPLPRRYAAQLVSLRARARLGVVWREAGARLLRLAETYPSVLVVDLDPLLAEEGAAADTRLSVYAKAHLSPALLARYAREIGHLARHLTGRTKKVLALDLDNTVWGGVLGEDGPDGIEVEAADSYRGAAFHAFQQVAHQLGSQGVLLVAASKNDPEPVREVLRGHPGMLLREEDFVRVAASWRPKPEALQETATALGLGVDSFVFVDDSPYECGLVRHALPEVTVVPVDDEPALHLEKLLRDGWFDVREVTDDDRGRAVRYREELVRKDFLDTFDSLGDYLRELRVSVRVARARPENPEYAADTARISQLTLRTNQFHLTTRRLQPAEVRELCAGEDTRVLSVRSGDRFGDNGLVGAVFLRRAGHTVHIDNFLLSCRVFARGIEQACLASVLRQARREGAQEVVGVYRKSAKNAKVADFYVRNGFTPVEDDGTSATFRRALDTLEDPPPHIRLTERYEDREPDDGFGHDPESDPERNAP